MSEPLKWTDLREMDAATKSYPTSEDTKRKWRRR